MSDIINNEEYTLGSTVNFRYGSEFTKQKGQEKNTYL